MNEKLLDHLEILNWVQYSSYRCAIGKEVVNFDDRDCIVLPSGKKVKITIRVEEYVPE